MKAERGAFSLRKATMLALLLRFKWCEFVTFMAILSGPTQITKISIFYDILLHYKHCVMRSVENSTRFHSLYRIPVYNYYNPIFYRFIGYSLYYLMLSDGVTQDGNTLSWGLAITCSCQKCCFLIIRRPIS